MRISSCGHCMATVTQIAQRPKIKVLCCVCERLIGVHLHLGSDKQRYLLEAFMLETYCSL